MVIVLLAWAGCCDRDGPTQPGGYWIDPDCENPAAVDYGPAWSPDGQSISYNHSTVCGDHYVESVDGIHVVRADGTGHRVLVPYGWDPDWSPDGDRIVFTCGEASCVYDLLADSVSVMLGSDGLNWPDWSPDGQKIALSRTTCCPSGLCIYDRTTRQKTWLGSGYESDWHPGGSELAFVHDCNLWSVSTDDSTRRQITAYSCGQHAILSAHWHPEGASIVYERGWKIWVIDADGSGLRLLGDGRSPAWSPDGNEIAFAWRSTVEGDTVGQRIWIMHADGSDRRQVTFPDTSAARAVRSPRGR